MPRFVVRTVTGFWSDAPQSASRKPGLSASVLDRVYCYRVVKTFRSEDTDPAATRDILGRLTGSARYGRDGALEAAQALADRLNAA